MTEAVHKANLRVAPHWTILKTAGQLHRSYGSVNEDLMLASWLTTHPQLEKIKTLDAALKFIRDKKREMRLR